MQFAVKAAPVPGAGAKSLSFNEKTMYRGKDVRVDDEIFVFGSDHQGGRGLAAKRVVKSVDHGPGIRVRIGVRCTAVARRSLGRRELTRFRDVDDHQPQTDIARTLYRHSTNKIAGISDEAATFLSTYF